jgi:hypothetical protein
MNQLVCLCAVVSTLRKEYQVETCIHFNAHMRHIVSYTSEMKLVVLNIDEGSGGTQTSGNLNSPNLQVCLREQFIPHREGGGKHCVSTATKSWLMHRK